MERCIRRDQQYQKILKIVRLCYVLAGLILTVRGVVHRNPYECFVSAATLLVIPALALARKIFRWKGGWQLETFIYVFSFLGWTLGGAALVYEKLPGFDKFVHCLSGVFVGVIALAFYGMLERGHSRQGENPATACFFVFFASMAVAGLFELCEFTLAPVMGRDLQHVLDTGVTDTMMDMVVCLLGTLVVVGLMIRSIHGKHDPLTDSARAFVIQNTKETPVL